jgi:hypothetical protein
MLETALLELRVEMRATIRMAGDAVGQTWSRWVATCRQRSAETRSGMQKLDEERSRDKVMKCPEPKPDLGG